MKRYRVKLLRHEDFKPFVIYLSADCVSCACYKASKFIQNAYGFGTYYLISVYQE
jgi:hypothetical protein